MAFVAGVPRALLFTAAVGLLIGVGVSIGVDLLRARATRAASDDHRLLAEVLNRVRGEYVDPIDDRTLMQHAIRGMLAGLDPYSAYLDREEYDEIRAAANGSYAGVGIEVSAHARGIVVVSTLGGSPAARADLRPGDLIVGIDRRPVHGDVEAALDRLRGKPGSTLTLAIQRSGVDRPIELTVQRALIEVSNVAATLIEPGFAYLRIASFSNRTAAEVAAALARYRNGRQPLRGVVLDLRNNPGGVLEAAVEVADLFLHDGVIVSAQGRAAGAQFRMVARPGDLLPGVPIVVLINGASASAAEILAAALHDHGRAALVGRRTFGKGLVQTVIPLSDGRALKLTTSRYFRAGGAPIHDRGVEPDLRIDGLNEAPVGIDAADSLARVQRDREIRIAIDHLKTTVRRFADRSGRDSGTAVLAR
ncbi:MAG: S41 family peptidase [Steroidobacteraceae bacterium]|nr:S41 family peptidase [Steroidobacteraceae bacterium]MDW8258278.1 S41 family peptidase [Gammaproteobacteria bacterium]